MRAPIAVALAALALLCAAADAKLYYVSGGEMVDSLPTTVVLHDAGMRQEYPLAYTGGKVVDYSVTSPTGQDPWLFAAKVEGGANNMTLVIDSPTNVGVQDYVVKVTDDAGKSAELSGKMIIAGIVILEDNKVVSGDEGAGIKAPASGRSASWEYRGIDTTGGSFSAEGTKLTYTASTGTYMEEVEKSKTGFGAKKFNLAMANGRYGTGRFTITFTNDKLVVDGEMFESVLFVEQEIPASIPCYAKGGKYEIANGGDVSIPMWNLEKPPRGKAVGSITLAVGSTTTGYEKRASDRSVPTGSIVFNPEAAGVATITCDGEKAYVMGGDIIITGSVPEAPEEGETLAKDGARALDARDGYDILTAKISFIDSSPKMLTLKEGNRIGTHLCSIMPGSECTIEGVVQGSAVVTYSGYMEKGASSTESESNVQSSFDKCEFQAAMGYDCDKLKLLDMQTTENKAVAPVGGLTVSAGLATWTIVLIAVVGAFAIILLIMLALWAVYRRNAEQSESDYSSSGPLGVPDPSDLLYEQSIVRDIYGRGDFPEGGPTAAAAAERAREADMREEFPRPPSSSGVSRGAQTDDASSTYSV